MSNLTNSTTPSPNKHHKTESQANPVLEKGMPLNLNVGMADYLFGIVKPVTNTVKRYPFYYTALMVVLSICDIWLPVNLSLMLGFLFMTSIPSAIFCFVLSRQVHLCPWHRVQCIVMVLPLVIPIFRIYNPNVSVWWVCGLVCLILLASLINRIKLNNIPATLAEWREGIHQQLNQQ